MAGAVPALRWPSRLGAGDAPPASPVIAPGPFTGTLESLSAYQVPDWFRDAKFGIWAHWGPQSAPEFGDWYARLMYIEGSEFYRYHVQRYGHPSKFGFKDVIATWKAERFDAAHLMKLYRKAGAKYFMSLGVHHDNFDCWDSKHTRWNSVKMGPRRNIVREFQQAARAEGLRFGISDHLWMAYKWFSVSRGSDAGGPLKGVVYDGADPRAADLYLDCPKVYTDLPWDESGMPEAWHARWFQRIKDLVDQHQPDILYQDGGIPFEGWGRSLVAHYYNQNARRNGGMVDAVYTAKRREDCETGACVFDVERGVVENIWPRPCQSHTCVGNWHYKRDIQYKSVKAVVDLLVDVVSRNGNLLLNFPLRSDGTLDDEELALLAEIGSWMALNGEAIYGTRPWKIFGEGPATAKGPSGADAKFNEAGRKDYGPADVRYTTKGATLYAFAMGWPAGEAVFPALAAGGPHGVGRVQRVEAVGAPDPLKFTQDETGLRVTPPSQPPGPHATVFKVLGALA